MAGSVVVPVVTPALREWLIKTTGFLGGSFQTPLYHLHPCRRARAGMTTEAEVRYLPEIAKGLSDPGVIPAQAGIQEGGPEW